MAVEHMMYFALGFLIAAILALIVLPSVWKRAVRLTRKRMEAAMPITMAEFRADKDQLRARFALTQRQLERNIASLRKRVAGQLAELDTARAALALAQSERDRAVSAKTDLEEREAAARARITGLERELATLSAHLRDREREIADLTAEREQSLAAQAGTAPKRGALDSLRSALTLGDREALEALEGINDAYSRISRAGSSLDALLDRTAHGSGNGRQPPSLAEELSQEEALEELHRKIGDVETRIEKDWNSEGMDKPALRNELGDIATSVSRLIYSGDSGSDEEESLFDRIRKYAGDSLDDDNGDAHAGRRKPERVTATAGTSLADRISAFRDIHAGN